MLKGVVPRLNRKCRITGTRTDTLVFDLIEPTVELPDAFLGAWGARKSCKKADWRNTDDGVFLVTKKDVQYWESGCKFISVKKPAYVEDVKTVKIDMSCGGAGMTWKSMEVWHMDNIAGDVLFTAGISSDLADDFGKPMEGGNDFHANVARKCRDIPERSDIPVMPQSERAQ